MPDRKHMNGSRPGSKLRRSPDATRRSQPGQTHTPVDMTHPGADYSSEQVMWLQRTIGNQATMQLLQRSPLQTPRTTTRQAQSETTIQRQPDTNSILAVARTFQDMLTMLRKRGKFTSDALDRLGVLEEFVYDDDFKAGMPWLVKMVKELRQVASGKSDATVKDVINYHDPRKRTGNMKYTHIAAALFTPELKGSGELVGDKLKQEEQEQSNNDDDGHVKARLNIVTKRILNAYQEHAKTNPEPTTVFVFLGPEWYFRRPDRPYSRKEKKQVIDSIVAVSALFPNMVIMPGTLISADYSKKKGWYKLTNTAMVAWNGTLLKTIDKQDPNGDEKGLVEISKFKPGKEKSDFKLGDLKFAIDICQDHNSKRAQKQFQDADVHLVSGWGQYMTGANSSLKPKGIGLSSDSGSVSGTVMNYDPGRGPKAQQQSKPDEVIEEDTQKRRRKLNQETKQIYYPEVPMLSYYGTRELETVPQKPKMKVVDVVKGKQLKQFEKEVKPEPQPEPVMNNNNNDKDDQ